VATSLLRLPQVIERCGYRRSSIYSLIRRGEFPAPVPLGPRIMAWDSDEIDNWIRHRIESGRVRRSGATVHQSVGGKAANQRGTP
jgi:prophage regulatory protein